MNDKNYIVADGRKWSVSYNGYYVDTVTKELLHRYIYEKAHGEIPEGYIIHHKDHNRLNNSLDNLEMMSQSEHVKLHAKDPEWSETVKKNREKARVSDNLNRYKYSEEYKQQRSENAKKASDASNLSVNTKRYREEGGLARAQELANAKVECTCRMCGKKYMAKKNSRVCSLECKYELKKLRNKGLAEINSNYAKERDVVCSDCGETFVAKSHRAERCPECRKIHKNMLRRERERNKA